MKARPILFSTPMVKALLEGRKTQTRRIIKPQPLWKDSRLSHIVSSTYSKNEGKCRWVVMKDSYTTDESRSSGFFNCPYGKPGDLLWVRETLGLRSVINHTKNKIEVWAYYKASNPNEVFKWNGKNNKEFIPSIHMPRWTSRLTLEITDIKAERVCDISNDDAKAEGCQEGWLNNAVPERDLGDGYTISSPGTFASNIGKFYMLWESIHGEDSLDANPWVWAVSFKIHKCNVDNFNQEGK